MNNKIIPISILVAASMSNAYEASISTLTIMNVPATFPIMNFFMLHLPGTIIICDILCAIAAYALVKNA